jgi:lipid-A-disaccharide synthase
MLVKNKTYGLLRQSEAALVTSGTAALETALFGVPQVVCYKGNHLSYLLAKRLIKVKYISLVNLILDKPCVKELIQNELNAKNLRMELDTLLNNKEKQDAIQNDYTKLWELLGSHKASETAAGEIVKLAKG